jgi:singapore isolate B (sub-type 7) whole genome shotgun sequence assembly, scaffold_9
MMSVPDLQKKVTYLRKLLDNRAASYKKILKLRGRLDLVLTHARSVSSQDADVSQGLVPLVEVDEASIVPSDTEEEQQDSE